MTTPSKPDPDQYPGQREQVPASERWSAPPPDSGGYPDLRTGPARPPREAMAGFWIRFVALFLDGLLLGIATGLIGALLNVSPQGRSTLSTILGLIYFTYFLATPAGQTLGGKAVGIRVVDKDTGGQVDTVRSFLRALVANVSAVVFALGYLWMLWDSDNQTWHDKAANTLVVRTSHYPPPR